MQPEHPNRIAKSFRLSNYAVSALKRLSAVLDTNMTQIIEIAVAQFDKSCILPTSTEDEATG